MSKIQNNWHSHMIDLFTSHKYILNCPRIKQSNLGTCSNEKLRTWTLFNDGTLWNTADFTRALGNVVNVKISDMISIETFLWLRRLLLESCKIMKTSIGEILLITLKSHWQNFHSIFTCNFAKSFLNGYFPMKLLFQESVKHSSRKS